jgi:hypothetical protein
MRSSWRFSERAICKEGCSVFEGAYPPGVTGKMIDDFYGANVDPCCGNCIHFDGDYCTKDWNNMDRDYCVPWRDSKNETDCCDDWELDEGILEE